MGEENNLLENIEKRLDTFLRPVNPEENYVNSLESRLFTESHISIERENTLRIILLIGLAFTFGLGMVLLLNRIFSRDKKS
jgi:hypothetical protein